jgi:nitrate/TMAO reductase-like tetraheme cytochrome c subunit
MQGTISKLQTIGMLITLLSVIGGGFYTWGTFNQRLDVIEKKKFVVNQKVDLTDVNNKIDGLNQDINIKINSKATEYLDSRIEELKISMSNPLLN